MKGFYKLPKSLQWIIASLLILLGFGILMPIFTKWYGLFVLPFVAPFFNFVSVPFFRLIGYYKYLNPFVLSTIQNDTLYDLHNIFTFDYLVHFKWEDRGIKVQKILLGHYLKALLTIIERIEEGSLPPEVKIVGHSYFFNDRTAEKLGFTISKASFFWLINAAMQIVELSYLYSFSKGKWALPPFWKVRRAEITGSDLVLQKNRLKELTIKILPKAYQ
jgi:hypothetical protein